MNRFRQRRISGFERPSSVRRAAEAWVCSSQRSRTTAMRCRAALAWRTSPVQPVPIRLPRNGWQRTDATERREPCIAVKSFRIITGGSEQRGSAVDAHAVGLAQPRAESLGKGLEVAEQHLNFLLQGLNPAGQGPECTFGGCHGPIKNTGVKSGRRHRSKGAG